jgi:hypothetical protein
MVRILFLIAHTVTLLLSFPLVPFADIPLALPPPILPAKMLLVDARVTQSVFAKTIPVSIPYNTTLTALDVARSMEQEAPLNAFDGLSLVSPPPSEALEPIAVLPGSQPDSLHMTWSLPPDRQAGQLLQTLLDRLSNLEDKSQATDQKISNLEESLAQTLPLSDAIHLQSLLDVWLHENGYGVTSGSRKTWIENNKIRLATVSGIPVGDLEDFLEHVLFSHIYAHL